MFYNFCFCHFYTVVHSTRLEYFTLYVDIKPTVFIKTKYYNKFCIGNVITKNYANAAMFF